MDSVGKLVGEGEKEGEGDGEMDLLLGTKPKPKLKLKPPAIGGLAKKERRQRGSSRRRVQWNDRNGNKLVEVLEFQRRSIF
ncbi:hypothetical protein M6B38_210695 [Iris pallida]|uniref:Uncharacterized protein n=1 Tax=Iris pallida TaxID=29817 RepID=A0AAX6E428_IRIPA|nr:hypothetical protein M6B38_210695 [Iris pallida]